MPRSISLFCWITLAISFTLWSCGQNNANLNADLTPEEKSMPEAKYYTTDFASVPNEVMDGIAKGSLPEVMALKFEDINKLTKPGYLEIENGYSLLGDGSAFVAVRTDLPGITKEMLEWWFWWHAVKDVRYKIWCPGDHYAIGVEDLQRLTDESLSYEESFYNNTHYPVEDIGSGPMNLSIRFVAPESFGFKPNSLKRSRISAVVCGVVGFKIGQSVFEHTYMCHVFRKKGDGLEMRSRFWIGKKLNMPAIKKLVINENLALDMLMHCSREFTHLAGFLPDIYNEFADQR